MKLGDLLELCGLLCIVAAVYLYLALPAALIALGLVLSYEGQLYSYTTLKVKLPSRPKWLRLRSGRKGSDD